MSERITIMLDSSIEKKLRNKQAEIIRKTGKGISFSRVLNDVLDGKIKI